MKLILLFCLSFQASASSIAKYRSMPEGSFLQKFILNDKNSTYEKTSNFFDPEKKELAIGIHVLRDAGAEYTAVKKAVDEYASKFKTVDDFLKTKDSDFNKVSGLIRHETIIMVDDFRIKPDSEYYAELNKLFQRLQKLKWDLSKGYRVSSDLKNVQEMNDGKVVKTLKYDTGLYCQSERRPTMCTYFGGGKIFVE